jgi:hypothetical protein
VLLKLDHSFLSLIPLQLRLTVWARLHMAKKPQKQLLNQKPEATVEVLCRLISNWHVFHFFLLSPLWHEKKSDDVKLIKLDRFVPCFVQGNMRAPDAHED